MEDKETETQTVEDRETDEIYRLSVQFWDTINFEVQHTDESEDKCHRAAYILQEIRNLPWDSVDEMTVLSKVLELLSAVRDALSVVSLNDERRRFLSRIRDDYSELLEQ